MTRARPALLPALRLAHRWLGVVLALVIAAVACSGCVLLFDDALYRWHLPQLGEPWAARQKHDYPAALAALESRYRDITVIRFPRPEQNAFRLWLADGSEVFAAPRDGAEIARLRWYESLPSAAHELHVHLLAGAAGERVNGVIALLVVAFALSGFVLWWPRRRGDPLHRPVPRGATRRELLRAHGVLGVWMLPLLIVFGTSGAALVFYDPLERALTVLFDDPPASGGASSSLAAGRGRSAGAPRAHWTAILDAASTTLPEGELTFYYPPRAGGDALTFRKRMPGEWHANGRSFVSVDAGSAALTHATDARRAGPVARFMNAIYPVHAATVGGAAWWLAALACGVALTLIAGLGLLAWCRGRSRAGCA